MISKSKKLDEEHFLMRLQNGYILVCEYEYLGQENKNEFEKKIISYNIYRLKEKSTYVLEIEEGTYFEMWEGLPLKREEK